MLSNKKIENILKQWTLEQPLIIEKYKHLSSGYTSENKWIINKKYSLKVTTNERKIMNDITLNQLLKDQSLNTSEIITTTKGESYYSDGTLYFLLSRLQVGYIITSSDFITGQINKARYLGEVIGQLDNILANVDIGVYNEPDLPSKLDKWAIPTIKKAMNINGEFLDDISFSIKEMHEKLPRQVIHRNLNPSNILYKDSGVLGFYDFELSEKNYRILDPVYAATSILSETYSDDNHVTLDKWIKIYHQIIKGYHNIVNLSEEEIQIIPYVVFANQLICTAYFSEHEKFQALYDINKKMLLDLINYRDQLQINLK